MKRPTTRTLYTGFAAAVHTHRLDIAGHTITVRSPADPAYVQRLGQLIDERARGASSQGAGPVGAVLLAALAFADDYTRATQELETLKADILEAAAVLEANE